MEKIYKVQMNSSGMPNFATAEEIDDEFKNFDRESLILLIEAQKERIGELLADRPQGEWEKIGEDTYYHRCPYCKRIRAFKDSRFCDWCGAKMKGADDE